MSCNRKIGPFDCCSVVHGDSEVLCLDLLGGEVDAVISDPPYGMDNDTDYTRFSGGHRDSIAKRGIGRDYGIPIHGDDKPFNPSPWLRFERVILWGANHFGQSLPRGTMLIWLKRNDDALGSFLSDAEIAWMKGGMGVYCRRDLSMNAITRDRQHPNQKPVGLLQWCIEKSGNPETILDPYCGSGSTLVAAKKLGRHFLGFEISEAYCQIARERLARIDAQPKLFEVRPEQMALV